MKMNKSIKELESELSNADVKLCLLIFKKNDILENNNFDELEECEEDLKYWRNKYNDIFRKIRNTIENFKPMFKEIENEFKKKK